MRRGLTIFCLAVLSVPAAAQPYAQSNGWQFDNFKDAVYPWDIYRDTFIGIPPTEDPWSSAFDVLFYDQVYKDKLSSNGNCFGLSLQSLLMLKKGGHLGYCLPIDQYSGDIFGAGSGGAKLGPTDPMLKRAINIMHGHQVNLPTLQLILDVISQHKNRDGSFAYTAFQNARMQNDPTLISITKTLNPDDGGHTMVAYDAQDLGGGNKRIFVYDPNRTWADPADRTWYTGNQNFVQITGTAWSFTMQSGATWAGDPGSGGNILIIPISVTGPHSRSPASLGDQIIGMILNSLLVTGSSAEIEQVTDATGKRLFRPGTREIDTDPSTGMMTMLPWYPSDQGAPDAPKGMALFHLGRAASTLQVAVRGGDTGYTLSAGGPRHQIVLRASGGNGTDVIAFHEAGSPGQSVEVRNLRGSSDYDIQLVRSDAALQRVQVLRASRLVLPEGAWLRVAAEDAHRALTLTADAPLRYDLELRSVTPKSTEQLTRAALSQEEGLRRTIRPGDWQNLRATDVLELTLPSAGPVSRAATLRGAADR
jgi:hypothetical protein